MDHTPQHSPRIRGAAAAGVALIFALAYLLLPTMGSAHSSKQGGGGAAPEKLGAGLLLTCDGDVLLLQRTSKRNHGTWGLPGGNVDETDGSLLETAKREAAEEMGSNVPPFEVLAEVLTQRGKRGQKHYTVFVARLTQGARASWEPQLNEEHSAWRWFKASELVGGGSGGARNALVELHPVVDLALRSQTHGQTVLAAVEAASQP